MIFCYNLSCIRLLGFLDGGEFFAYRRAASAFGDGELRRRAQLQSHLDWGDETCKRETAWGDEQATRTSARAATGDEDVRRGPRPATRTSGEGRNRRRGWPAKETSIERVPRRDEGIDEMRESFVWARRCSASDGYNPDPRYRTPAGRPAQIWAGAPAPSTALSQMFSGLPI